MKTYSKNQLTNMMKKFWDKHASKMYDYPSLDITFEDGSELNFFIQPREYMGLPIPVAIITYKDDERTRESNPFPPALVDNLTLHGFITSILNQMDVVKPVNEIYENLC